MNSLCRAVPWCLLLNTDGETTQLSTSRVPSLALPYRGQLLPRARRRLWARGRGTGRARAAFLPLLPLFSWPAQDSVAQARRFAGPIAAGQKGAKPLLLRPSAGRAGDSVSDALTAPCCSCLSFPCARPGPARITAFFSWHAGTCPGLQQRAAGTNSSGR